MRLPLLVSAGVLLVALLPCPPCRALLSRGPVPGARQAPQHRQPPFAGTGDRQLFPRVAAAAAAASALARQPRGSRGARR
uniref:Corticotropin releasing hormone isoform 2 n=1 Tax=Homo sapiens TaxID=9606 RepID=A0A0S2Z3P5_HUMAN|nr:corticotropin releasing hormone isoform 2 [Homo sapiens]